ncbi:uncharacterized protein LOC130655142 [Hydractinia symbiolongicarpus]|uniref:uncharacterized protein LOC130655142 n=1 Tax=Hydractinia symbiolongicarpus TaxID=13093 RepID=UPI00254CD4C4|nr:uncharacterized protein LOC130655142 [Hydractinia symbiolongicarpus]
MSSTSSHTDTDADFDTGVDNVENDAELCTKSSQTEVTLEKLQQEIFSLQKEKEGIKKELSAARVELLELKNDVVQPLENASSTKFSYDTVVAENMLNFYTGITTPALFEWFLSFFVRKVRYFSEKLSHNDHLLLVLMKLKLGLLNKDLAYRFGLSETVASRIYRRWVPITSRETCHLIIWPDREALRRHLPNSFKKNFQNCTCIIDCTEIFAERPYNIMHVHKHGPTTKILAQ